MWLILLDKSGSMSGPFEGDKVFSGRSRISEQKVKIEAAKEALLDHLKGLGSPSQVAIICFHSEPSVIFSGLSNETTEIQNKLNSITAGGGTDIAAALDAVRNYVAKVKGKSFFRTLVISDGLSELEPAHQAASRLINQAPMSIDVILIDRTDPGEEVARAIALNGNVLLVTTNEALADQIGKAALIYSREAQAAEEAIKENELLAHNKNTGLLEKLAFTATYPSIVNSETWYSLLVYLHIAGLQNEIEKLLTVRSSQLGIAPARSTGQITVPVQRETTLKLVPHLEGFEFNPTFQEIKWYEDIQEINFRLRADTNFEGKSTLGSVDVYVGACLVALIPLAVTTRKTHDLSFADTSTVTTVERFESIFISYSHRDTEIIDACVAAYDALGIKIYIDKDRLKSGYIWSKALQEFIDDADLFQLYWSEASSKSIYVEEEWRYALSIIGRPSKGERYIRPLRWEDPHPEPPQQLSHLHFATLDLQTLFRQKSLLKSGATQLPIMPVPKLHTTVIPTLSSIAPRQTINIQENMVQVVELLEQVTQLRYYPVSTLLVDEYLVKSVRSATTVDTPPPADMSLATEITSSVKRFFITQVSTYGIYSPANSQETDKKLHEWSIKQGVSSQLILPGNAKVLLCLEMQGRLEEQVGNDISFQGDVTQIASLFQSCVLIHEHFHAILETGLDAMRHTSVSTSDPDGWKKALPLNESLAVWVELHFARLCANSYLKGLIDDYIQAGKYPEWPYQGAEYLEKIYQDGGLTAIQTWIEMIRKNPGLAQDMFNNLVTQ